MRGLGDVDECDAERTNDKQQQWQTRCALHCMCVVAFAVFCFHNFSKLYSFRWKVLYYIWYDYLSQCELTDRVWCENGLARTQWIRAPSSCLVCSPLIKIKIRIQITIIHVYGAHKNIVAVVVVVCWVESNATMQLNAPGPGFGSVCICDYN